MADWKTYAKAARNTARRQAPEAKDAARRATDQAGAYVRAAGKALDEGHRSSDRDDPQGDAGTRTAARPVLDQERLGRDAAAYYTVARRRVSAASIGPRILRALRDALLIGLSLLVIWGVLYAAGIPIPFTTVLIIVGLIVVISFGSGLFAQRRRAQAALADPEGPRDR